MIGKTTLEILVNQKRKKSLRYHTFFFLFMVGKYLTFEFITLVKKFSFTKVEQKPFGYRYRMLPTELILPLRCDCNEDWVTVKNWAPKAWAALLLMDCNDCLLEDIKSGKNELKWNWIEESLLFTWWMTRPLLQSTYPLQFSKHLVLIKYRCGVN